MECEPWSSSSGNGGLNTWPPGPQASIPHFLDGNHLVPWLHFGLIRKAENLQGQQNSHIFKLLVIALPLPRALDAVPPNPYQGHPLEALSRAACRRFNLVLPCYIIVDGRGNPIIIVRLFSINMCNSYEHKLYAFLINAVSTFKLIYV